MCIKIAFSGFSYIGRICRSLATELFEAVTKHAKKKTNWVVDKSKSTYEKGLESYNKSITIFSLQILVFGLGFYTIGFFLPEKIPQILNLIPETGHAPYLTIRSGLAGIIGWAIDDFFPVTPISAFKITLRKAVYLILTYSFILCSFGYKTVTRLAKKLIESLTICLNHG